MDAHLAAVRFLFATGNRFEIHQTAHASAQSAMWQV